MNSYYSINLCNQKRKKIVKLFCITESLNMNISHQLFEYKITFAHSQLENTNSKGDFVVKYWFETFVLKISSLQK